MPAPRTLKENTRYTSSQGEWRPYYTGDYHNPNTIDLLSILVYAIPVLVFVGVAGRLVGLW